MKHLFYIHSFITYLVAREVIRYDKLIPTECVFMYGRGFISDQTDLQIEEVVLPFTHHPVNSFRVERLFWKGWRKLKEFDAWLETLIGSSGFQLYTNQTGIDFIRLMMTHPRCKGFSLLEEGVASYHQMPKINNLLCPAGHSTFYYKVLLFANYKGRLTLDKWFYHPGYSQAYGTSAFSFPEYPRKVQLTSPFANQSPVLEYNQVLVLDATAEYGLVSNDNILAALEEGLKKLSGRGMQELWVKYHPDQLLNLSTMQVYREFFKSLEPAMCIHEIPQHVCLELLAGNSNVKDVSFYVFLSSVGMYAGLQGRKVYSLANLVVPFEPDYQRLIDSLPEVYKEVVEFIPENDKREV